MNKICIISRNHETYFVKRVTEEVGKGAVLFNPWKDCVLPESQKYLIRTTGVYRDNADIEVLRNLPPERLVNPLESILLFRSKLSQYKWFEKRYFLIPSYIDLEIATKEKIQDFFALHERVIIKPHFGQGGWGIKELDLNEALKIQESSDKNYLLQKYTEGEEYRVFFIKDHPLIVLKRRATKGIAANFQSEGEAELSKLDEIHLASLQKIIEASGALYGAIDLKIFEKKLFILELNTVPGFVQVEKLSNRNLICELLSIF